MRKKINKRFLGVLQLYHTKDALCVQNIWMMCNLSPMTNLPVVSSWLLCGHLLTYTGSKFERDNSSIVVCDFGQIVPEISNNRIYFTCRSLETSETGRPRKSVTSKTTIV
jgi:hypothetical protein